MERCFIFQLRGGGVFFKWGASFLSGGGVPHGGASILIWGVSKKIVGWGVVHPPHPAPMPPNPQLIITIGTGVVYKLGSTSLLIV